VESLTQSILNKVSRRPKQQRQTEIKTTKPPRRVGGEKIEKILPLTGGGEEKRKNVALQ